MSVTLPWQTYPRLPRRIPREYKYPRQCLYFDGTAASGSYGLITYPNLIPLPFTLIAWVNNTHDNGITNTIMQKDSNFQWHLDPTTLKMRVTYHDGGAWQQIGWSPAIYLLGVWTHMAATLETEGANTRATFYINGRRVYTGTDTGQPVNVADISIGRYSTNAERFAGYLSDLQIVGARMSDYDIYQDWWRGYARPTANSLVNLTLEEGMGLTCRDNSGLGNDAIRMGVGALPSWEKVQQYELLSEGLV